MAYIHYLLLFTRLPVPPTSCSTLHRSSITCLILRVELALPSTLPTNDTCSISSIIRISAPSPDTSRLEAAMFAEALRQDCLADQTDSPVVGPCTHVDLSETVVYR